jgi:hypothetical protein
MVHYAPLANDPHGSLTKFFGYALTGLDRNLGLANPPQLMEASLPYVSDVAAGDLYRIALRASKRLNDRMDLIGVALSAYIGAHAWPPFFGNLTLKRSWARRGDI